MPERGRDNIWASCEGGRFETGDYHPQKTGGLVPGMWWDRHTYSLTGICGARYENQDPQRSATCLRSARCAGSGSGQLSCGHSERVQTVIWTNGQPEFTCNAKRRQRSKSMPQRSNSTPKEILVRGGITREIGSHPKIEICNTKYKLATPREKLDT